MSLNGGYAMIKYNSTQEELQIAYRSKKPVLFYDENNRSHWAVVEETATQSVDEETQEPITLYQYSYKLLNDIEALVDSNGNPRFIGGNGTPGNVTGLTVSSSKWTLNGTNLIFEISGSVSESITNNITLCSFNLPKFITDKITTSVESIVDLIETYFASISGGAFPKLFTVNKNGNTISFVTATTIDIQHTMVFKIRYNIIIDNN